MKNINKKITIEDEETTVKDFFKSILKQILVDEPPKRLLGDSGWWHDMVTAFAKGGAIEAKVSPCCDKWCEEEAPCGYSADIENKDANKQLTKLIDSL